MSRSNERDLFERHLHRIVRHAEIQFRSIKCPDTRADRIQETLSLSWKWFRTLHRRGKHPEEFISRLADFAVRAVRNGRRVCGQEKATDAMSSSAQQRHGFTIQSLPASTSTAHEHLYGTPNGQQKLDAFEERLQDNTQTPVPDQVQFRLDFRAWLKTLTGRERRMIRAMGQNERTKDLSRMFDLSEGRISQMRGEFRHGWRCFLGEIA